jgi:Domain of unknown function (DUF5916)
MSSIGSRPSCTCALLVVSLAIATLPLGARAAQDAATAPAPPVLVAIALEAEDTIVIDGQLDEPIWQRGAPATDFLQLDPDNGAPATERTEVRIAFDHQRLYLGVTCYDSEPDAIRAKQMLRDADLGSDDRFMWAIDSFLDGRTGYYFEINPAGLMGDGLIAQGDSGPTAAGGTVAKEWDGIWIARVRRGAIGWTAEIELPFRTFNFDPESARWGINFQRTVRRKNEDSVWSGHARNQGLLRMTNAGRLTGLTGMSQGAGLDVKPHAVGSLTSAPGRGRGATIGDGDVGVDIFYSLTPGLRANFTVNTDFAETEVDERRVNLTRFPLFFPEKREFFVEGSGFFDFAREPGNQVEPFFSRQIGLDASFNPQKIDFGLKLTGQLKGQDIGLLQVRTGRDNENPAIISEDFTVLRVRRRVLTQSYFGGLYTRRAARDGGAPDLHTTGADFNVGTSSFRGSQNLEMSGFWLWTTNPLGTGQNHTYGIRVNYPNDVWSARMSLRNVQPYYNPAVGFNPRSGYRRFFPVVRFSPPPLTHRYIRRFAWEAQTELLTDMQSQTLLRSFNLTVLQVRMHAGDDVQVRVTPQYERLETPFLISPGIVLPVGSEYTFTRYRLIATTASQRVVAVGAQYEDGGFYSGDRREITLSLTARPLPGILASVENEWNRLNLPEGEFSTQVFRGVLNVQFSPWISLGNNLQYDTVSGILGWQARFRWILRPGNDLFFVYTHNWRELEPERFATLDRRAVSKVAYTHRF